MLPVIPSLSSTNCANDLFKAVCSRSCREGFDDVWRSRVVWLLRKLWHLEGLPSPASWFSGTGPHASRSKTVTMCRITTISLWFVWDGGLRLQTTHALLLGKGAGDSGLCRRRWSRSPDWAAGEQGWLYKEGSNCIACGGLCWGHFFIC